MTAQFQQDLHASNSNAQLQHALHSDHDGPAVEVEFTWLMARQGWWVDTARFAADAHYASELLQLATKSQSFALRECASLLQDPSDSKNA